MTKSHDLSDEPQLRCAAYPLMATKAAQHVYHIINAVTARLKIILCPPPAD